MCPRRGSLRRQQYNRFYRFWAPLLGLFTGARISELCQLTVDDVKQDGDVHYLDIVSDKAKGKRTKTAAGVRRIPIHSKLIAIGFLEYVEWLRSTGQERILVDAPLSGGRPGAKVSDWFRNFRTSLGLTREGLSLHSFRHNANTAAFKAGNNPAAIQQVIGHKKAGLGISNNYLHDVGMENAAAVIESLNYGVNVSHLKDGWKALTGKKT